MPRFYPNSDCDFYVERVIDNYHSEQRENHILRENPLDNPCCIFQDQDHPDPHRSVICSWGIGENFMNNTGWKSEKFSKTRIRSITLPTAGQPGLWKITRTGPCGTDKLPLHTWKFCDPSTSSRCMWPCRKSKSPSATSEQPKSSSLPKAHDCIHNKKKEVTVSADKNDECE